MTATDSRSRSPFDSTGLQRLREMLQVIRTTFTAPRLERRARRMMVPQSCTRTRHRSLKADMLLRLVTHQRRYGGGALTCLIPLLR